MMFGKITVSEGLHSSWKLIIISEREPFKHSSPYLTTSPHIVSHQKQFLPLSPQVHPVEG